MYRTLLRSAWAAIVLATLGFATASASSHSEAPGTAKDRLADDTDLYAWVASDAKDKVTIVGNWVPLLEPNGGPNFYGFDDDATYYMNIDNVGDAQDHIRYAFSFRTERRNGATFLYNTGVVTSLDDPDLNVRQFCTVVRIDDGVPTVIAQDVPVAPNFVGPVSMPRYADLAASAVRTLDDGTKLFIGPRDDPFFVDLAAVFDLLTLPKGKKFRIGGVDGVAGYDVLTIAIQIPMTRLTRNGATPDASNGVIGIYNSVERFTNRTINTDGTRTSSGPRVQVSRLGMPLVNEVVIALQDKDRFNASKPTGDGTFLNYVTDPELARLFTALYGLRVPPTPRNDLVAVFLTGIPGLNQPMNANQVPCEMLRLNMTIAPANRPSRLGLLAGDIAGFPNGRRLADDVVDIAERVVAGATAFTPDFNVAPNNRLGDAVDCNDKPFLPYFPYVALPHNPVEKSWHSFDRFAQQPDEEDAETSSSLAPAPPAGTSLKVTGANPGTTSRLEFTLATAGRASLSVYDLQGRTVRKLFDQDAEAGTFAAQWDGRDDAGARVGPGVYFARLIAGSRQDEKKIVLR